MSKFVIRGSKPVSGTIIPVGNKNAVFPILSSTLLANGVYHLSGVPAITDVKVMLKLMERFGVKYYFANYGEDLTIDTTDIHEAEFDPDTFSKIRGSNVLLGAVLARFGKVKGYYPGGDKIGLRSMMAHFDGFEQSGFIVEEHKEEGYYYIYKSENFESNDINIFMYEVSVTGTENMIILNTLQNRKTIITNAASEPHVKDACNFLKKMGASIEGEGTNRIVIYGGSSLHSVNYMVQKDPIYIGSFIIFSLVTNGELYIKEIIKEDILPILTILKYFNVKWEFIGEDVLHIFKDQDLKLNEDFNIYSNVGIYTHPWPNLPTDLMPIFVALATKSQGEFLFFEQMYANRISFAEALSAMGADIKLLDVHRLVVKGKTVLKPAKLISPDLRSGVLYLACMLASPGESILENVSHIERGYPRIEETLTKLGVDIKKNEDSI